MTHKVLEIIGVIPESFIHQSVNNFFSIIEKIIFVPNFL